MRLTKTIAMIMMVNRRVPLFPRVIRRDARKKATFSSSNIAGSLFPDHEIPVPRPGSDDEQDEDHNQSGGIPVDARSSGGFPAGYAHRNHPRIAQTGCKGMSRGFPLAGKNSRGIVVRFNFSHVCFLATAHGEIDTRLDRICIIFPVFSKRMMSVTGSPFFIRFTDQLKQMQCRYQPFPLSGFPVFPFG